MVLAVSGWVIAGTERDEGMLSTVDSDEGKGRRLESTRSTILGNRGSGGRVDGEDSSVMNSVLNETLTREKTTTTKRETNCLPYTQLKGGLDWGISVSGRWSIIRVRHLGCNWAGLS